MTEKQNKMMIANLLPARLPRLHAAFEVRSRGQNDQIASHVHEAAELVFVVDAHLQFGVTGKELDGRAGTLHVLPPGVPHDQRCRSAWMTQCVLFHQADRVIEEAPRTLDMRGDDQIRRWMEDLCRLQSSPAFGEAQDALIGDGLLLALLGKIGQAERCRQPRHEMHPRLTQAIQYLNEHVAEEIPQRALADAACVSGSHLRALFRQQFGCGPHQYQQRLRLEAARALLHNPYLSVEEVARQCGYDDPNYFARLFRRVTGQQPRQWRREIRNTAGGGASVPPDRTEEEILI